MEIIMAGVSSVTSCKGRATRSVGLGLLRCVNHHLISPWSSSSIDGRTILTGGSEGDWREAVERCLAYLPLPAELHYRKSLARRTGHETGRELETIQDNRQLCLQH
jgi:hypothetical protein